MAGPEVGVQVACPSCGETVFQHGMIPILAADGSGITYVCRACARQLIDVQQTAAG
jgi:DNA-directed RNA polymerase subunit RPC12/RpoP